MIRGIQGFGDLGKIEGIPSISDTPKITAIVAERIPVRPRILNRAAEADKLEAAALQGVLGTLPERIVWKWLIDKGYRFIIQEAEFGGSLVLGGAVVDFLVLAGELAGRPVALRVQGDYWHGPKFPERRARDDEQYHRLTAMGYLVVDLWEHDIYEAVLQDRLTAYIMGEVG